VNLMNSQAVRVVFAAWNQTFLLALSLPLCWWHGKPELLLE